MFSSFWYSCQGKGSNNKGLSLLPKCEPYRLPMSLLSDHKGASLQLWFHFSDGLRCFHPFGIVVRVRDLIIKDYPSFLNVSLIDLPMSLLSDHKDASLQLWFHLSDCSEPDPAIRPSVLNTTLGKLLINRS